MATPQRAAPPSPERIESPPSIEPQEVLPHDHPSFEEIAAEAYAIYMANGANHGNDVNDWLEAERRLRERPRAGQ
jgi:hypothetical protein